MKVQRTKFKYRTPTERDSRPVVEKGTDVTLALLMQERARDDPYDIAILVASDTDYYPAVEVVRKANKAVVGAHASRHRTLKDLVRAGARSLELELAPCSGAATSSALQSVPPPASAHASNAMKGIRCKAQQPSRRFSRDNAAGVRMKMNPIR